MKNYKSSLTLARAAMTLAGAPTRRAATVLLLATLTMTAQTVWAQDAVTYIDMDGKTKTVTEYTEVTTDMTADGSGKISWNTGTYVVKSDVTLNGCIMDFNRDVIDLIVCDGATLTVNGNENDGAFNGKTLNIYAQSTGTGMGAVNVKKAAVCSHLNIAGGTVTLDDDDYGFGLYIQSGDNNGLTVNGGDVTILNNFELQGTIYFSGNGFVTLNGGTLTVTNSAGDSYYAIEGSGSNTINFNGGTAVINGSIYFISNINLNSGNVTVNGEISKWEGYTVTYDFTRATDSYYINAFSNDLNPSATRTVQVKDGADFRCNGKSYSGTLTDDDISAISDQTMTPDVSDHFSVNDAGTEYTIHTATGWNLFCDALQDNDTWNRFSGKTVKLGDDITVTRMAGGSYHDFCGTFDGQGHTLTVGYGSASAPINEDNVAPFRNVEGGCVIKNLHVAGDIYTSGKYAAGIAGTQYGAVSISNCHVSTTIHSYTSGDGTHGGIVGQNGNGGGSALTIEGCLFDGKLLTEGTTATSCCGGFVGWQNTTVTITKCLYAPADLADGETEVIDGTSNSSATFARNGATITNCYYTRALGTAQGKACHSVTAGENVTIGAVALTGTATEYEVSGIIAYSVGGLQCGETLYYGSGDEVSLTLSNTATAAPQGYQYGYTASAGTLDGTTLTMPDEDVTITAALAPIDWATVNQGNSADPYMIYNKDQLLLLAHRVNGTNGETAVENGYQDKYFKLGADITFDHDANEGDDYAENYEAIGGNIGGNDRYFAGDFDGDGHTVSGIRIRKDGTDYADYNQGLFGQTYSGANIHDVHLTNARIKGFYYVGGIIGSNSGTVSGCTVTDSYITAGSDYGTVCGWNGGTLTNNYYHGCTVNGTAVTSGMGCGGSDLPANNGALPAYAITLGDGVSTTALASAPENGFVYNGVSYYREGLALPLASTLGSEAPEGYTLSFSANGTALSGNTYTVNTTDGDVTITAAIAPIDWATVNQGNSADPYMIYNKDQLLLLAHRVNGTNDESANDYEGKYFKLGADITFDHPDNETDDYAENYEAIGGYIGGTTIRYFNGKFDGDGHTVSGIRIRKTGSSDADIDQGLFGLTSSGANIHDVHLTDARITGSQNVGGIAGYNNKGYIMRCSVTDSYIAATDNWNYGTICGRTDNTSYLRNNYYHGCTVNGTENATNVGCGGSEIADLPANNGALPAYAITLGDGVSTTALASAPENGFVYNDVSYYREGLALPLASTLGSEVPEGYTLSFSANGTALSGNTYTVNTTDGDVTITAAFRSDGQQHEVSYVDADGTARTAQAIALDGTETSLAAGWYFVGKDIDYTATITLDGDVNLILADGCTMNIGTNENRINGYGINGYINDSYNFDLTIYGQSLGTGDLNIYTTGNGYHYAVIARNLTINGGNVTAITDDSKASALYVESDLTINGGNVTATSIWSDGNGICCGNSVTINGGIVTANSSNTGITGYGGITINGGIVTANSSNTGITGYGGITINGGIVTANGSNTGIYATADDGTALTLGWTRPDDRITVSSISTGEGTVAVKDGQALADESGHIYTGTLTDEQLATIAKKELSPANLYVINGNSDETVSFTEQKEHATVIYDRKFTAGVASTIVLPFDFDAKALDGALHTISSIDEQDGKWVATASDAITQGKANTPYLFKPNNDIVSTTFRNVTIALTEEKAITIGKSKWQMKGVYQFKEWDADSPTDYGFAGAAQQSKEGDKISAGDFVRVGSGAKIRATRCYLTYADGISKASPILPDRITVIFPDATASVIEPQPADPSEDADPSGDITTPISEIAAQSGTKVWGYDGTIYIESQPYTPYTMIDLAGRTLKNGVTNSTREEVTLSRPTGIVIVRIGGKTFKIFNR